MRITTKNVLLYILGNIIVSLGIYLMIVSKIGVGSWDAVFHNTATLLSSKFWIFNLAFNSLFLIFVMVYRKSFESITILITIAIQTAFLALWEDIVFKGFVLDNLTIQISFFAFAILVIPVGLNFIIISSLPKMIYDEMTFVLMDITKIKSFGIVRIGFEVLAVTIAIIVGLIAGIGLGQVGPGTIIMTFLLGPLIDLYLKFFRRFEDKLEPISEPSSTITT